MTAKKVLIVGGSGLIGHALFPFLSKQGFNVKKLSRIPTAQQPCWNIKHKTFDLKDFSQPDIIINLAGENIAEGRWTKKRKQALFDSRILSTALLAQHFTDQKFSPQLFINASAIGFYGSKNLICDEQSPAGYNFLSKLSHQWEKSCDPLLATETRLVKIRTGIVLSPKGGALAKMLPAFKLAVGGKIGTGKQIMSWIDLTDFCRAILFIINTQSIQGAINLTAPNPVSNQIFSKALAHQLSRPCICRIPVLLIKILFGEMGDELLLSGCAVQPKKLLNADFKFKFATIEECLANQLKGSS